jgi:hypothetical protein
VMVKKKIKDKWKITQTGRRSEKYGRKTGI